MTNKWLQSRNLQLVRTTYPNSAADTFSWRVQPATTSDPRLSTLVSFVLESGDNFTFHRPFSTLQQSASYYKVYPLKHLITPAKRQPGCSQVSPRYPPSETFTRGSETPRHFPSGTDRETCCTHNYQTVASPFPHCLYQQQPTEKLRRGELPARPTDPAQSWISKGVPSKLAHDLLISSSSMLHEHEEGEHNRITVMHRSHWFVFKQW